MSSYIIIYYKGLKTLCLCLPLRAGLDSVLSFILQFPTLNETNTNSVKVENEDFGPNKQTLGTLMHLT